MRIVTLIPGSPLLHKVRLTIKLTDDEERVGDARIETMTGPRSSAFGRATC